MEREPTATEPTAPTAPREGEFRVQLEGFEGPLDLLLHLIKKHALNVLDLPVAFITERYLAYLKMMRELDLEVAGEYLLMAATLAHLKSKLLLPRAAADQSDEAEAAEEIDPRLDLIRRLLEYQKYKEVAEDLGNRAVAGRDVFTRGLAGLETEGPAPLADIGMFKLLDAFQAILDRAQDRSAFEITAERITIRDRMTQITELLRVRRTCVFEDLFEGAVTRYEIVVTFLALLEMTKLRITRIFQTEVESPIHVHYALLDASAPTVPPEPDEGASAAGETQNQQTQQTQRTQATQRQDGHDAQDAPPGAVPGADPEPPPPEPEPRDEP